MRPDSTILVLTNVGPSTVTATPVPDSSAARVSDSDSTPALLTLLHAAAAGSYAAMPGAAPNAAADATLVLGARHQPVGPDQLAHFRAIQLEKADGIARADCRSRRSRSRVRASVNVRSATGESSTSADGWTTSGCRSRSTDRCPPAESPATTVRLGASP